MAGQRATDAEVEGRIGIIYTLLLNGLRRREILQYVSKNEWGISNRQVDEYIQEATAQLREKRTETLEEEREISLKRHDDLYFRAIKAGALRAAIQVQQHRDIITGVSVPASKTEITGKDGSGLVIQLSTASFRKPDDEPQNP